jgi:hypothetical protein
MTAPRPVNGDQRAVLDQAHALLADFDARHDTMLAAALAALDEFLALVRAAVMGLGGGVDLDQFPTGQQWVAIAHRHLDQLIGAAFTDAYLSVFDRAAITDANAADIVNVNPFVQHHIETVTDRLRDWPQGIFEEIRDELHASIRADETVEQLRDRIGAVLRIDHTPDGQWQWRADRIARTETAAAVNGGAHQAQIALAAATGRPMRKQWLATSDERTRHSHAHANGQVRPLGEPFTVGGHHLQYPGDPTGPAEEVINCRCTVLFLHPDMNPFDLAPIGDATEPPLTAAAPEGTVTALTDQAPPTTDTPVPLPDGWRGILAPLDAPSGDGRIIAHPGEQLQVRPLPLPLLAQEQLADGHDGAVVVGLIDRVWIEDGALWGEGPLDLADDAGARWARRLADGYAGWVSVDLDSVTMTEMMRNTATGDVLEIPQVADVAGGDPEMAGLMDALLPSAIPDGHELVYRALPWRLMSSTLVSQAAFHEARVAALWGYTGQGTGSEAVPDTGDAAMATEPTFVFPPNKPAPGGGKPPATPGDAPQQLPQVGDRVVVDDPAAGGPGTVTAVDTTVDPVMVTVQLDAGGPVDVTVDKVSPEPAAPPKKKAPPPFPPKSAARVARALTAGGRITPPREWFNDPNLDGPTPLTVDGARVYGHLAVWDTCHIGITDTCTTPPRTATGYALFHTGEVVCADGSTVPVGKVTLGTGHADPQAGFRGATDHYDNSGTAVAVVRAYEDDHGIVVAGALCPDADAAAVAALRRSPLSGDWRRVGGNLELVAALAVNVPGFPITRPALVAAAGDMGRPESLVAAGALPPQDPDAVFLDRVSGAVRAALDDRAAKARRVAQLTPRILAPLARWEQTRVALAAARINGDTGVAARAAKAHGYTGKE